MGNRVVDEFVLRKYRLVTAFHMLVLLCKAFVAKCFLVDVFYLPCDDIDPLIVVFVNR